MTIAVRGAVQFASDDKEKIKERTQYLLSEVLDKNNIDESHIVSIFFTVTNDLKSINPAAALRAGGNFSSVPLFCAQEPDVNGAMPRIIRVLLIFNCLKKQDVQHIYLDGAERLRPDLN